MVAGFGWAARMFEYCRSGSFSIDANSDTGEWQQNNGDGGELVNTFQSDGPQSGQEFNDTIIEGLRQARIENQSRASEEAQTKPLLQVKGNSGTRYNVLKVIGKGGFGEVYKAEVEGPSMVPNMELTVSIKAEHPKSLKMEMYILTEMKGSTHFCTLYDSGYDSNSGHYFMVMTMLGPNLSFVRKSVPRQRLSFSTGIRVAIQMLNAIEELHSKGFVSRDVKPSNFAIGLPTQRRRLIYMLDFGISHRYWESEKVPRKQSVNCPWRGTTRYAPLANHRRVSPSPKDDLESWLYSVIELMSGSLPWTSFDKNTKEQTFKLKMDCRMPRYRNVMFRKCPPEFIRFLACIDSYNYYDWPDYEKFYVTLTKILDKKNIAFTEPYDWEIIFEPYIKMNDNPS